MKYPPVLNKKDFTRRYRKGEFGNASPTWDSVEEWKNLHEKPKGMYHLRNRIRGGPTFYDLDEWQVIPYYNTQIVEGDNPENYYLSLMCPTEHTLIQGEVMQDVGGLKLFYSTVTKPMRQALKEQSQTICGIIAVSVLKYYLCPNSWEWLNVLLDRYPGHVVEFTTLGCEWGTVPNFNTLWWEVRLY